MAKIKNRVGWVWVWDSNWIFWQYLFWVNRLLSRVFSSFNSSWPSSSSCASKAKVWCMMWRWTWMLNFANKEKSDLLNKVQDDKNQKKWKWSYSSGVRWRKPSWTLVPLSELASALKTSATTMNKVVNFLGKSYTVVQLCHLLVKSFTTTTLSPFEIMQHFPTATPSTPESGVQCSEVLVQVIPENLKSIFIFFL